LTMLRLPRPKFRSPVWNHYEKLEENDDGGCKVKCIHCGRVANYHSLHTGTSSLKSHVKRCLDNMK
ncbi:hypothetical protein HAX54_000656, partial [Datura stramonium]|nr:hypothetical protein [Datura stramonium]